MTTREPAYIGVDPGATGAIALIRGQKVTILDFIQKSVTRNGKTRQRLDLAALCRTAHVLAGEEPARVVIEDIWLTGADHSSMGALLFASGAIEAAFVAAGLEVERVAPLAWKHKYGLVTASTRLPLPAHKKRQELKERARAKAALLFPAAAAMLARVKDDGRAEALLIADYARRYAPGK